MISKELITLLNLNINTNIEGYLLININILSVFNGYYIVTEYLRTIDCSVDIEQFIQMQNKSVNFMDVNYKLQPTSFFSCGNKIYIYLDLIKI